MLVQCPTSALPQRNRVGISSGQGGHEGEHPLKDEIRGQVTRVVSRYELIPDETGHV